MIFQKKGQKILLMKTIIILGAGPFGRACANLLNDKYMHLLAFADNNPALHGTFIRHIPVISVEHAVRQMPDIFLIGVMGSDRTQELKEQVYALGFRGTFMTVEELYQTYDIRSATLYRIAERLHQQQVGGAVAELGVYKGDTAWKLNLLFPDRKLYLFDTFSGFDKRDVEKEKSGQFSRAETGEFADTSEFAVRKRLLFPHQAIFQKGFFPETAEGLEEETYALVSLDADLYAPILAGLEYFYPRLNHGGMILLHDYNNQRFSGAKRAVEDYEKQHGALALVPLCDLHGTAVIVHS